MERKQGMEFREPNLIVDNNPFLKRSLFNSLIVLWVALCIHPFSAYAEELV